MTPPPVPAPGSRREFVRTLAAAGVGAATLPALAAAASARRTAISPAQARTLWPEPDTPDEALARLYAGNRRFVAGEVMAPNRNLDRLREVAGGQRPFAAFLGCADSRVPIEIVFDQGFGDLFVTRVAGNVADPTIIGSLEFGALVLGAQLIYVLGHSRCGAVIATVDGQEVPGQISTLYQHIRRAARDARGDVADAIRRNVKYQAEILAEASPVLARLIREGKLKIAGGVYDLATGVVTPVEPIAGG